MNSRPRRASLPPPPHSASSRFPDLRVRTHLRRACRGDWSRVSSVLTLLWSRSDTVVPDVLRLLRRRGGGRGDPSGNRHYGGWGRRSVKTVRVGPTTSWIGRESRGPWTDTEAQGPFPGSPRVQRFTGPFFLDTGTIGTETRSTTD